MARTSKTAEGRSAAAKNRKKVAQQSSSSTAATARKGGRKTKSSTAADGERQTKVPRVGATSKNVASSTPPSSSSSSSSPAHLDAVVPRARSRAALGDISTINNNNNNNNNNVDYPVDDSEKKIRKTIEARRREGTTSKMTTTTNTTARVGRGRGRTADAFVDEEEEDDTTTTAGSESDPDEDEGGSDYEETSMAHKKAKLTKATAVAKLSDATSEKKSGRYGGANNEGSSSSFTSRGRGEKTATVAVRPRGGGVSVLEVLEEVVADTESATQLIMMPSVTRKLSNADTNGDGFDSVDSGCARVAKTAMYEEEYRANSNDNWRCMSAVDW